MSGIPVFAVRYGIDGLRIFLSKKDAENWQKWLLNPPNNPLGIGPMKSTLHIGWFDERYLEVTQL